MKETLGVSVSKCFPVPMTTRDNSPDPVGSGDQQFRSILRDPVG